MADAKEKTEKLSIFGFFSKLFNVLKWALLGAAIIAGIFMPGYLLIAGMLFLNVTACGFMFDKMDLPLTRESKPNAEKKDKSSEKKKEVSKDPERQADIEVTKQTKEQPQVQVQPQSQQQQQGQGTSNPQPQPNPQGQNPKTQGQGQRQRTL